MKEISWVTFFWRLNHWNISRKISSLFLQSFKFRGRNKLFSLLEFLGSSHSGKERPFPITCLGCDGWLHTPPMKPISHEDNTVSATSQERNIIKQSKKRIRFPAIICHFPIFLHFPEAFRLMSSSEGTNWTLPKLIKYQNYLQTHQLQRDKQISQATT